jgi:hypothetical protein
LACRPVRPRQDSPVLLASLVSASRPVTPPYTADPGRLRSGR